MDLSIVIPAYRESEKIAGDIRAAGAFLKRFELAGEVISIERHAQLAAEARDRLGAAGYSNVTLLCGDGSRGHPERAPYDAILVTAGSPDVPGSLERQLALGGRLVCPTGDRDVQTLVKVVREEDGLKPVKGIRCVFVPLIGAEGWPENTR